MVSYLLGGVLLLIWAVANLAATPASFAGLDAEARRVAVRAHRRAGAAQLGCSLAVLGVAWYAFGAGEGWANVVLLAAGIAVLGPSLAVGGTSSLERVGLLALLALWIGGFVCSEWAARSQRLLASAGQSAPGGSGQRNVLPAPSAARSSVRGAPGCPSGMVRLEEFCVDRYEAHLVDVESGSVHSPYRRLSIGRRYRAVSAPGVVPQGYIHRGDAASACRQAGKRLCRAREWAAACRGTPPEACNLGKPHVMTRVFGRHVTLTYDDHYNSPRLNREPGFLARTGEYSKCVSEHGAYDMVGNLHEWVADDLTAHLEEEIPIPYDHSLLGARGNGVFMGGFYSAHDEHGHGCEYVTTNHAPDYHDYSTGFRCCADLGSAAPSP